MANTLMSLLVKLGIDSGDFDKGIEGAGKKASNFADGLLKIGGAAVVGGIAAVGAGIAALATTIGPASDLNETVSKVGVVFGDSAAAVLKFGDTAATALGMSKNEALAAAGTYGNLFRSMGMGTQTSADMSTGLVQLAGDLASFNNMPTAEVLEKLRSGLSGEVEPLRSLGVNLTQDAVKAKAMAMGLMKGNGELTAAAKAQATYALIMEQTTLAQGDFARTSGGLANQQRILAAQFENMKATIGTALLPLITLVAGAMTTWLASPEVQAGLNNLVQGLMAVGTWLGNLFTQLSSGGGLQEFAASIMEWIGPALANLKAAFDSTMPQIQAAFAFAWNYIQQVVAIVGPQIAANVQTILNQIAIFWQAHGAQIIQFVSTVWNVLVAVIGTAIALISGVITAVLAIINGNWSLAWQTILDTLTNIMNLILAMVGTNLTQFLAVWSSNLNMVWTIIVTVFNNIVAYLKGLWATFKGIGQDLMNGMKSGIQSAIQGLIDSVVGALKMIIDAGKKVLGIGSPSKIFAEIGQNMMLGMEKGIQMNAELPNQAVQGVSNQIVNDSRSFNFNYAGNASAAQVFQGYQMARLLD